MAVEQHRYTVETKYGTFSDALYYDIDNPPPDLEQKKQARVDAWIAMIEYMIANPPAEDPPVG